MISTPKETQQPPLTLVKVWSLKPIAQPEQPEYAQELHLQRLDLLGLFLLLGGTVITTIVGISQLGRRLDAHGGQCQGCQGGVEQTSRCARGKC